MSGTRSAARILLLDDAGRLLLLEAVDRTSGCRWWVAPGGGLREGEGFEAAAARELYEETGIAAAIGPWVWTRRHAYVFEGRRLEQIERFFVARVTTTDVAPTAADAYVIGHRWWSAGAIAGSSDVFAPRRLAALLPAILRGDFPRPPIDCGV